MNRLVGGIVAIAAVVTLMVFASKLTGALVYYDDMLGAGTKVAGALFVTAVLLERSLAVLNSLLSTEEERAASMGFVDAEMVRILAAAKVREANVRLAVGFLVAVFVSAAGIRALEPLVKSVPAGAHSTFFYTVDVVITAGLLAGGSNALAEIIDIFKARTRLAYADTMRRLGAISPARFNDASSLPG